MPQREPTTKEREVLDYLRVNRPNNVLLVKEADGTLTEFKPADDPPLPTETVQ